MAEETIEVQADPEEVLPPLVAQLQLPDKKRRVIAHQITVPLPPDRLPLNGGYGYDYSGGFQKLDYAAGQTWSEWRKPTKDAGTAASDDLPKAPGLFNVGGAKVPHNDPDAFIVPSVAQAEEQAAAKKAKKAAEKAADMERFRNLDGEALSAAKAQAKAEKMQAAKVAEEQAALQKLVTDREHQLRGLAVRIARRVLGFTFGQDIAEPEPEQMTVINEKIQEVMPGAPQMTAAQAKCWLFHSSALEALSPATTKTEFYHEEMRNYQSINVDVLNLLTFGDRFDKLEGEARQAVSVLQGVLKDAYTAGKGLVNMQTMAEVPNLQLLEEYLEPKDKRIKVPLAEDSAELFELSPIATQLYQFSFTLFASIKAKVLSALLKAHPNLSNVPTKRTAGDDLLGDEPRMSKTAKLWHEKQMAQQENELVELRKQVEDLTKENEQLKSARSRRGAGAAAPQGSSTFDSEVVHTACTTALLKFKTPGEFKQALLALEVNTSSTAISALRKELASAITKHV